MEEAILQEKPENTGLNIKELFFKYVRFLPLFIISVALALLVAYLYLRYATPVYRSIGTLVIQEAENNTVQGDEKFQELFSPGGNKNIQSEIEYLHSRPLMERVVRELNLNLDYYGVGNIKELNIYKSSPIALQVVQQRDSARVFTLKFQFHDEYRFQVDEDPKLYMLGQTFETPYGVFKLLRTATGNISKEYKITWRPTALVASKYSENLLVTPKAQGTGILTLTLESTNPILAADIVNQLMHEYQEATIEDKNTTTNQTLVFIDGRLQKISHELDSVTNRLLAYQQANNLIDFETQSSTYLGDVSETSKQIEAQRMQLELAQMVDAYLRDRRNNFSTTPSSLGLTDPTLNTLIAAYNEQQLERKALIDGNVPRTNIKVQQLEAQIEKLRESILENLRNIIATQHTALTDLQRKSASLQAEIRSLPAKQQNLVEIRRQQESKLAVYNFLQEKREETAISLAATISNTKILEQASANHIPVKPDPRTIKLLAIAIGLALPALVIFVFELLNDKVNGRSDVEKLTNATILGEVGHSYAKEGLVVTPNNRGYVAEQFRIIRSNLQYVLHDVEKPVILVTSSFSGEGKSFISTNFSSVMALASKRTVVLEFDIRKPKILSQLNMPKKPGLTNYILGKTTLQELPIAVEGQPNLFVIACGPVPPNPAELLLDEKLGDLFTYLRQQFDVIIIDTAPVGMVSDAMTLSKFANVTLYIVRQGHTFKKQIGLIEDFYQQQKLPKVSIILNDVKVRAGYGYGRYGYGYGYGYGSNYFEDETPPPTLFTTWFGWLDLRKWRGKKKKTII
jgi:tyrosine-protein kinase Etk/Wzc